MSQYDFFSSLSDTALEMQVEAEARKKQEEVRKAAQLKQSELDPNYRVFDDRIYDVVDGDTVRDKRTGKTLRVSGGDGRFADTFETGLHADGTPNYYYENNPGRFKRHQQAYAKGTGKNVDDVSIEDLYEAGQAQKQAFKEQFPSMRGEGFRLAGKDVYGRDVMAFDNSAVLQNITGIAGLNASYTSKYNWKQLEEERLSGAQEASRAPAGDRNPFRWTGDQVVGATATVGDFGIDALVLASTLIPDKLGGGSLTTQLLRGKEEGWGALRDYLTSDQKLYMEKMRQKRSSYIQDPLYRSRKAQNIQNGDSETMAAFTAWVDGALDTLENLVENPTEIVDIGIESLPYMVGSGLVAKIFTKKTIEGLIKAGAIRGSFTKAQQAIVQKTATRASIGFTAVTEGLGNGISAYQKVDNLSEAELADSPAYQKLLARGMSPEEAKRSMATEAGWRTFIISGVLAGVANKITGAGRVEGNLFRRLDEIATNGGGKAITSKLALTLRETYRTIEPAAKEGTEEIIQSGGGEAIAQGFAAQSSGVASLIKPAASADAAAMGLAAGVATGGAVGNAARIAKVSAKGILGTAKLVGKGANKLKSSNADGQVLTEGAIRSTDNLDNLRGTPNSKILGGTSSIAGKALAEIDKASGGQTAANAAQALDDVIKEAEGGGKILVNNARFLLRRYKARVGANPTAEQTANIARLEGKVSEIESAFKQSISGQVAKVAQTLGNLKQDGKLDSPEAKAAIDTYLGLAKTAESYGMNANAIASAAVENFNEDSMPEGARAELRQYRSTQALMGELTRTVEGNNKNQTTMQRVAAELLLGGGKKKGLRDYVELMQEAVTNRNWKAFQAALGSIGSAEGLTNIIDLKQKQVRVLSNFVANLQANMDEKDALAKAQKDAGVKPNKAFNYDVRGGINGVENLLFQMQREVGLMAATRHSLIQEWNKGAASEMKTKAELAANRRIMSQLGVWEDTEDINFAEMEAFVEGATGENIEEARRATIQLAKKKAERARKAAKDKATKARLEMLERRNYNKITYTPRVIKDGKGANAAANPLKTALNIFQQYKKTGNGNYIIQALEHFRKTTPKAFSKFVEGKLRALVKAENLLWPHVGDRNAWLKEQAEGQPTITPESEPESESEESQPQAETTKDGDVGSVEEEKEAKAKIKKVERAIKRLPAAIRKVIRVIHDKVPTPTKAAFLSLKSNLAEAGITHPDDLRWAFKNKDLPGLKDVKSQSDLDKLIDAQWEQKTNHKNYPRIAAGEDGQLNHFKEWVATLSVGFNDSSWGLAFMEMMMDVPLKEILDLTRHTPGVPLLNIQALRETYEFYTANPNFQGVASYYSKTVAKYVTGSNEHEQSASGKGYWVVIPRVKKPWGTNTIGNLKPSLVKRVLDYRDKDPRLVLLKGITERNIDKSVTRSLILIQSGQKRTIEQYQAKLGFLDISAEAQYALDQYIISSKEVKNETARESEREVAINQLIQLSPPTWCTSKRSYAAGKVSDYENHILIVNGKKVVGIELKPGKRIVGQDPETGAWNVETGQTQPGTVNASTSINNNSRYGSSIDHLDDTLAYMDKHGMDYSHTKDISRAIAHRDKGWTDRDVSIRGGRGDFGVQAEIDPGPEGEAVQVDRQERARNDQHTRQYVADLQQMLADLTLQMQAGLGDAAQLTMQANAVQREIALMTGAVNPGEDRRNGLDALLNALRTMYSRNEENHNRHYATDYALTPEGQRLWQRIATTGEEVRQAYNEFHEDEWMYDYAPDPNEGPIPVDFGEEIDDDLIFELDQNEPFDDGRDAPAVAQQIAEHTAAEEARLESILAGDAQLDFFENTAFLQALTVRVNEAIRNSGFRVDPHLTNLRNNIITTESRNEIPFSKRVGGIEGWAAGEQATLNAAYLSEEDAPKVALHEVAHLGMIRIAKEIKGGWPALNKILQAAKPRLMEKAEELIARSGHTSLEAFVADYGWKSVEPGTEGEAQLLIELAARWAETFADKPTPTWWKEFLVSITDWVKQFMGKELSSEEVDILVAGFIKLGAGETIQVATPQMIQNVEQVTTWIREKFGEKIFDFLSVVATDPNPEKTLTRSGFYNRDTKEVTIVVDQIFNRAKLSGLNPQDWTTWVVWHEVGHKAIKALFGEAALEGKKAYEKALLKTYEASALVQELANAVSMLKWGVKYADLTGEDKIAKQYSAMEEAIVEIVAALQVHDMNADMALFDLGNTWGLPKLSDRYSDRFSEQSVLKKTLEGILDVLSQLLAALGIITPNISKNNAEHFFMSLAAKELMIIFPENKVTREFPTMEGLRSLAEIATKDLTAFYAKMDKDTALAQAIAEILDWKDGNTGGIDSTDEEDPWANIEANEPVPDWTGSEAEQIDTQPVQDPNDPFYTEIPQGNMGTWDEADFEPQGTGAPESPVQSTEAESNTNVAGNTESTEQTGKTTTPESTKTPLKPYTETQLFGIRMILDALQSIIDSEENIPAHQVSMPTLAATRIWYREVRRYRDANRPVTAKVVAEWMKAQYEEQLEKRQQETPVINSEQTDNSKATTEKALELNKENGTITVETDTILSSTLDFLSDKAMPLIWKLARHADDHVKKGQRWTPKEVDTAMQTKEGRQELRADLQRQFNMKGIPVWAKQAFRKAKDESKNILNSSLGIFTSLQAYAVRRNFFTKLGLNDKEMMGMNTIIDFVNQFQEQFNKIHLGLFNELGTPAHVRTPFRTGNMKVDANGAAILNPILEYAMQLLYNEEGKLNENFISIMALEVGSWLTSAAANALNNDESTIKSLYGLNEDSELPMDFLVKSILEKAARQGTLKTSAARAIGKRIVQQMAINMKGRHMTPLMRQTLEVSLGEMAIATAIQMNLIESREIPVSFREAAHNPMISFEDFEASYNENSPTMVVLMPTPMIPIGAVEFRDTNNPDAPKRGLVKFFPENFQESFENTHLRTAFMAARTVLEKYFSNGTYIREPGFEVQEPPTLRARTNSKIPKVQRAAMAVMNAQIWEPMKGAFRLLSIIPAERLIEVGGGHSEQEIEDAIDLQKEAMESKNATIRRAVDYAKDWVGEHGFKPFHFAYKMITTGRLYIDSNTINVQADKFQRFLFGMKGWEMTISTALNPTGKLKDATRLFKMSVAVALDLKVDKKGPDALSLDQVVTAVDDFLSTPLAMRVLNAILEAEYTKTQLSPELIDEMRANGFLNENFHSLLALREYARYRAFKGAVINVNLPLEVDGKTNGIAIGAMQTPFAAIIKQAEDEGKAEVFFNILAATGIFRAESSIESYAEFREDVGARDNYEGVADDAETFVNRLREEGWLSQGEEKLSISLRAKITEGRKGGTRAALVSGFLELNRKLAKTPLMVSAYNAGIDAVKRALNRLALENYFTKLSQISTARSDDAAADYDRLINDFLDVVIDMGRIIYSGQERVFEARDKRTGDLKEYRTRDMQFNPYSVEFDNSVYGNRAKMEAQLREAFPTFEELNAYRKESKGLNPAATRQQNEGRDIVDFRNELAGFNTVISKTFGAGIAVGIENRLAPMKTIRTQINQAVLLMNVVAQAHFNAAVDRVEKSLGRQATDVERQSILNAMQKKGWLPSIRTPDASTIDEYLPVHDPQEEPILGPLNKDGKQLPVRGRANFRERLALRMWKFLPNGLLDTPIPRNSSSSLLLGLKLGINIGVRALVKMIHSSDGTTITRILGNPKSANMLGIHDAFVGNPLDVMEHMVAANEQFLDVQANWDLATETRNALNRFLQLMTDDLQMTDEQRQQIINIFAADLAIEGHWKGYNPDKSSSENFYAFLADFDTTVDLNTEARAELFEQLSGGSINQFAIDKGQHSVGESLTKVIESLKTIEEAARAVANLEGTRLAREVQMAIADIAANTDGNPLAVFLSYLGGQNLEGTAFTDALDVVWGAFNSLLTQTQKDRSRDRFREAIKVLKATTTLLDEDGNEIPLRVTVDANNRGIGSEYKKATHTIVLRPGSNLEVVLEDLLRLGIVAATSAKLSELHADPKDRELTINRILQKAVKWANHSGKDATRTEARRLVLELAASPKRVSTQLRLITEYLSNIQGSLEETTQGLSFEFNGQQVMESLVDMTRIMAEGKNKIVYHSSPRGVNQSRFNGVQGNKVTVALVQMLMAQFEQTDGLSAAEQAFLNKSLAFLLPALETIDEVLLKQVDGQPDRLNEGEYVDENSTILLETTDNVLSSPAGMSKQEVLLHEIFHPLLKLITEKGHSPLLTRLKEIFELAEAARERGQLTWRMFLPDTSGVNIALDEQIAKERFAHIFQLTRDADGNYSGRDQEVRYHEFFAIAMSNMRFANALLGVSTKADKYTFWQNNLFNSIAAFVAEAFRWLLGAVRHNNKNLKEAVDQLAKDVLAANRRHQRLAKKAQDSGPIQGAMDWLDRKVVERFAALNTAKLQEWARKNSVNYADIQRELAQTNSPLNRLRIAAKNATASVLDDRMSMQEFRNALESAMLGYNKNNTMYQLLQEILPWAERNHRYIDLLRRSNVLIDMTRQKIIETLKGTMKDIFDPFRRLTDPERTAMSKVLLRTDLSVLLLKLDASQIMDLLREKARVVERINALLPIIEQKVNNSKLMAEFNLLSRSLAHLQIHGVPLPNVAHSQHNAHNIVALQAYLGQDERIKFDAILEAELIELIDELTTLRAILELPQETLDIANSVIQHEMARSVDVNGFSGTLALSKDHKAESLQRNFRNNPINVWKGYVYETFDEDVDVKFVADTAFNELALTNDGYKKVAVLPQSKLMPNINVAHATIAVYVNKSKGVNTYSKSITNMTSEQKHGFGLFDLHLTVDEWNNDAPGQSASAVIALVEEMDLYSQIAFNAKTRGLKVDTGPALLPLYNEAGEVVDFRYTMSEEHKTKFLQKREFIDEILPRMFGAIEDRENTPIINHEMVDLLFQEHNAYKNNGDHRFMIIGSTATGKNRRSTIALKNDLVIAQNKRKLASDANDSAAEQRQKDRIKLLKQRITSQEMWDLLPKETQLYAEQIFGGKFLPVRDEMYNMIFGFRKLAFANGKWLGKAAPIVRMIEKVWQEIIQWERFRIAVLEPAVVIGNMISNFFILLAHRIPPQYIWRYFNEAVLGMRAYQQNVTKRQKLAHQIAIARQYGKPTASMERQLFRMDHLIEKSEVHDIVEEGLFTSIVEEFGGDEQSYRRRLTNRLLDKVGVVAGSQSAVKLAQEVHMVPGSQMARFALMGTQYGDFVARYIKLKWDTEVKQMPRDKAIREALDTFIYYNIPQNKYLQWMNDNGLFMFTKFFFRIQHIAFRLFQRSPSRALAAFAFQAQFEYTVMGDSIGFYAGNAARMFRKFDPMPIDNIANGSIFEPSLLKWIWDPFFGD